MATFDLNDDQVVVIIGTGAGGGVLANELAQKGVKVVALEAGGRYLPEDYINDEWESFGQLAWLDARTTSGSWRVAKDFAGLPAWIVKAVGGTTTGDRSADPVSGSRPSSAPPSPTTISASIQDRRPQTSAAMRSQIGRRVSGARCMATS